MLLKSAYSNAKVFLFPSYHETFGLVLLEAAVAGANLVVSKSLPILDFPSMNVCTRIDPNKLAVRPAGVSPEQYNAFGARNIKVKQAIVNQAKAIRARIEWLAVQAITTGKNIIKLTELKSINFSFEAQIYVLSEV